MTCGTRQRDPESRTPQSCPRFVAALRPSARCGRKDGSRLRSLAAPGVPLPGTCTAIEAGRSGGGGQNCVYGQASPGPGRTAARLRQCDRSIVERHCQPSVRVDAETEATAWLSLPEVAPTRFSLNIALIVCCTRNWNTPTTCWCPRSGGRWALWQQLRRT